MTIAAIAASAAAPRRSGGNVVRERPRPRQAAMARAATSTPRPGRIAACRTSWVLTMRTFACVAFTASVCALIIASPSSSSTSDGGMTMPSVLATQTVATASAGATWRAARAGATRRASMCRLAPTEPFIGASKAPTPSAESCAAAGLRAKSRSPLACIRPASGRRFSSAPMKAYRGSACSRSCSSRPTTRDGTAPRKPTSNRTARHADGGEERGDTEEHAIHGQAGRDHEPHGHDEHGHAEPAHGAAATSSSPASGKGCGPMARVRSACSSMSRASSQALTRIRK
jgi:hypothetical protein